MPTCKAWNPNTAPLREMAAFTPGGAGLTPPGALAPGFPGWGGATPPETLALATVNPGLALEQALFDQALASALSVGGPVSGLPLGTYSPSVPSASAINPVYAEYSVENLLKGLDFQKINQILRNSKPSPNTAPLGVPSAPATRQAPAPEAAEEPESQQALATQRSRAEDEGTSYDQDIREISKRYTVSPALIQAMLKAESNGNPNAQSNKGAKGLMQFEPGTFKQYEDRLAKLYGRDRARNPFDPQVSIEAAFMHLSELKEKFGSDALAVAAYNAGAGNVQKYHGIPPFRETQAYVSKVLGDAQNA